MSELLSVIDAMTATDPHLLPSSALLIESEELIQAKDQIDALLCLSQMSGTAQYV